MTQFKTKRVITQIFGADVFNQNDSVVLMKTKCNVCVFMCTRGTTGQTRSVLYGIAVVFLLITVSLRGGSHVCDSLLSDGGTEGQRVEMLVAF